MRKPIHPIAGDPTGNRLDRYDAAVADMTADEARAAACLMVGALSCDVDDERWDRALAAAVALVAETRERASAGAA